MKVKILIPSPLRSLTANADSIEIEAETVREAIEQMTTRYPELRKHLFNEEGELRSFVNVYINDEDIRYLEKENTKTKAGDVISIVPSIAGGNNRLDLLKDVHLTKEEIQRYSRHLVIPDVGMEGQKQLKVSSVLIIGAGGLGSPLGMYLAAAGVGRIGIVDFDVVDESNLQRQILYSTEEIGKPKIEVAKNRLKGINPLIHIETYETKLTSENALSIFESYDVIVDGTDNFPTRYLVNDACVLTGKPNVYGSIFRFEGQVSVFGLEDGPCYRCLYPEPPPPGLVPSCAEGGVFGVLPGIVGSIQANEVIKLILGKGDVLKGRLLLFDALGIKFRELKLRKNPECPVCGENPTVKELIDYEEFCGVTMVDIDKENEYAISVGELKKLIDERKAPALLDVREPFEFNICNLGGKLIPIRSLPSRMKELDSAQEYVVYCHTGNRSHHAVELLKNAGFKKVKNLIGGINEWAEKIDKDMPRY